MNTNSDHVNEVVDVVFHRVRNALINFALATVGLLLIVFLAAFLTALWRG